MDAITQEIRRWERSSSSGTATIQPISSVNGDVRLGESYELDKPAGLQGKELEERGSAMASPIREKQDHPTKIRWTHAWGMMKWGKEAGPWGQGPEGLDERKNRK
jgi:protein AFG1